MSDHQTTWNTYTSSWKVTSAEEKRALFDKALNRECVYTDPLTQARGWDALLAYMLDFHKQIPGGYFSTTQFMSHHDRSIAQWEMRDGNDNTVGNGISYGEYDDAGKLVAMSGFFETPPGN